MTQIFCSVETPDSVVLPSFYTVSVPKIGELVIYSGDQVAEAKDATGSQFFKVVNVVHYPDCRWVPADGQAPKNNALLIVEPTEFKHG